MGKEVSARAEGAAAADSGRSRRRDPERTRELILDAATTEFATKGIGGARVDAIAARSGANKRMIYHYFGDKQRLYLAVLERMYTEIRDAETELKLEELEPKEAMERLIAFSFDYYTNHPHFIRLLDNENLHKARNLKKSPGIRQRNSPLIGMIRDLLKRGEASGDFRGGVDPVQLYISIAGLGYFYFANIHTLSEIFGMAFQAREQRELRKQHVIDVILGYLRPIARTRDLRAK
jgi:AcrR family transcriptional regulator